MKNIFTLILLLIFAACSKDENCLKSAGEERVKTTQTNAFHTIDIPKGVEIEIVQSDEYQLKIESFEHRIDQINLQVNDSILTIENLNACGIIHRQKVGKITISTPTLKKIISRTQFEVYAKDTLTFPNISIISSLSENSASSTFNLTFDNQSVTVEDNEIGYFDLSGKTKHLILSLYGGSTTVDARNLQADVINFFHRSTHHVHLFPVHSIEGTLASTGNVYLYNKAAEEVFTQKYTGRVIYQTP